MAVNRLLSVTGAEDGGKDADVVKSAAEIYCSKVNKIVNYYFKTYQLCLI